MRIELTNHAADELLSAHRNSLLRFSNELHGFSKTQRFLEEVIQNSQSSMAKELLHDVQFLHEKTNNNLLKRIKDQARRDVDFFQDVLEATEKGLETSRSLVFSLEANSSTGNEFSHNTVMSVVIPDRDLRTGLRIAEERLLFLPPIDEKWSKEKLVETTIESVVPGAYSVFEAFRTLRRLLFSFDERIKKAALGLEEIERIGEFRDALSDTCRSLPYVDLDPTIIGGLKGTNDMFVIKPK